jgi:nanoRNase/pAp phosphatase (c-di-AMP/oligoRNAs hydrolase)
MFHDEQLNNLIGSRVREVIQLHLQGTPEEFEAATEAVMDQLSFVGANLQSLVSFTGTDITTFEGKAELANQLVHIMREQN